MPAYIHMIVGPMFSGKSTELFKLIRQFMVAQKRVCVVKHAKDTRWTLRPELGTHDSKKQHADIIASSMSEVVPYVLAGAYEVVCVDEGQFFEDIADKADYLANCGVIVVVAGLVGNFLNHPTSRAFQNMVDLFPRAETVTKLMAVCSSCQYNGAAFYVKILPGLGNGTTDLIGGADKYKSVCRPCSTAYRPAFPKEEEGASGNENQVSSKLEALASMLPAIKQEALDSDDDDDFLAAAVAEVADEQNNEPSTSAHKQPRDQEKQAELYPEKKMEAFGKLECVPGTPALKRKFSTALNPSETERTFEENPLDDETLATMIQAENIGLGIEKRHGHG